MSREGSAALDTPFEWTDDNISPPSIKEERQFMHPAAVYTLGRTTPTWFDNLPIYAEPDDTQYLAGAMAASCLATGESVEDVTLFGHLKTGVVKVDLMREFVEMNSDMRVVLRNHMVKPGDEPDVNNDCILVSDNAYTRITVPHGKNDSDFNLKVLYKNNPFGLEIFNRIRTWFKSYSVKKEAQGVVYAAFASQSGITFSEFGAGGKELLRDNYTSSVLGLYDRIKEEVAAEDPHGKLTILSGPPGCGKTYLIRGMLQEVEDVAFVIIPDWHMLSQLVSPTGIGALSEFSERVEQPIVLILEDADDALAPREEGDMSLISSVLNLSDGLVGSVLNIRIVATTNRDYQSFDKAILRPGRLSTHCGVGLLPTAEALRVFQRLCLNAGDEVGLAVSEDVIRKPMSLAEVYQVAYDKDWTKGLEVGSKRKMGFGG